MVNLVSIANIVLSLFGQTIYVKIYGNFCGIYRWNFLLHTFLDTVHSERLSLPIHLVMMLKDSLHSILLLGGFFFVCILEHCLHLVKPNVNNFKLLRRNRYVFKFNKYFKANDDDDDDDDDQSKCHGNGWCQRFGQPKWTKMQELSWNGLTLELRMCVRERVRKRWLKRCNHILCVVCYLTAFPLCCWLPFVFKQYTTDLIKCHCVYLSKTHHYNGAQPNGNNIRSAKKMRFKHMKCQCKKCCCKQQQQQ